MLPASTVRSPAARARWSISELVVLLPLEPVTAMTGSSACSANQRLVAVVTRVAAATRCASSR